MMEVMGYFGGLIAEKRDNPEARGDDIASHAIEWEIDGEKPSESDLLSCMLLLFMAGLDTVAAQLSYTFYHLATHPDDRRKIVEDPSRIPLAVEELARLPDRADRPNRHRRTRLPRLPGQGGRHGGVPARHGQPRPQGTRMRRHSRSRRTTAAPIAFGAGPHRCLGSHLARQELVVALEEWNRLIPDYEVADEAKVVEHTGGVYSLECLPLRWDR